MNAETFMNLVKENDGFEFVIGFKGNENHSIGGRGNKYWYYVDHNGKKAEYYIGTNENGSWTDKFYTAKGSKLTEKTVESGITIKKIVERAYFYQEKIGQRRGKELEKYGYPCLHYVFGFGERAWAVSKDYGITVDFNDINDNDSAYRLMDLSVGSDVEKPRES